MQRTLQFPYQFFSLKPDLKTQWIVLYVIVAAAAGDDDDDEEERAAEEKDCDDDRGYASSLLQNVINVSLQILLDKFFTLLHKRFAAAYDMKIHVIKYKKFLNHLGT